MHEKQNISIRKTALRTLANKYGTFTILEAGQGRNKDGTLSDDLLNKV